MKDKSPLVSIVIPTRNAAHFINSCLESIKMQTYPRIEIIVADNYSIDKTREIAESFNAKVILAGPKPPCNNFFTAPIQRKVGCMYASGEFISLIDSDMILTPQLVEDCMRKCLEGNDAVIVHEISFGEGFWSKCKVLERLCYMGDCEIEAPRFIKRSVYEQIGGWRDCVGALDDWDLKNRLKSKSFKIAYSQYFLLHNEGHLILRKLFYKKLNMGKSVKLSEYLLSSKVDASNIFFQLTPMRILKLIRRSINFSRNMDLFLGMILMKFIEGAAFQIGLLLKSAESL